MSFLARNYSTPETLLNSRNIADGIGLPIPNVAKLLTILSNSDLVKGTPGPTGGYCLAKDPSDISLYDIVTLFENTESKPVCPLGQKCCDEKKPCPLHSEHLELYAYINDFLRRNRLNKFM